MSHQHNEAGKIVEDRDREIVIAKEGESLCRYNAVADSLHGAKENPRVPSAAGWLIGWSAMQCNYLCTIRVRIASFMLLQMLIMQCAPPTSQP
jgi:hypothetical protein